MTRLDHADPTVSGASDTEGAQRGTRAALVECGAMSMHLCAVGDVAGRAACGCREHPIAGEWRVRCAVNSSHPDDAKVSPLTER